jgi:hypothetical protein
MTWDEECLEYILLTKPKSEKHQQGIKIFRRLSGIKDEKALNKILGFLHAIYTYMKRCNVKTGVIMKQSFETQQGKMCMIPLLNTGMPQKVIGKSLAQTLMKYEMCSQSPKEDRFKPIRDLPNVPTPSPNEPPIAVAYPMFPPDIYAESIRTSQSNRTIKKGEFEGETTADNSGPIDEFEAYEKITSGVKLSCSYTTNLGSESHDWSYSDELYIDGEKVTDLGWSVSKKDGKKIFIVKGMAQLVIPMEFFINFETSSSVATAAGIRAQGQCF